MKIAKDNPGYIVLYNTEAEGLVPGTWGLRIIHGLEELEAEVSAILNEIELFKDDETHSGTVDDIKIFRVDNSFAFKVEFVEKVITTSVVKLVEKNKPSVAKLREVAPIPLKIGPAKLRPPISLSEDDNNE